MPKPKSKTTPQPAAAVPYDPDDPYGPEEVKLPPEAGEPTDGAPPDEEKPDSPPDDGEPMLFLQPARLGALHIGDNDVELDGEIEFSWMKGATSTAAHVKAMVRRKVQAIEEAIGATAAISGALDVWREGTPSEGHEALGGTKAQRTNWRTEFSWTVYLVGSTGVLPEAPRIEASAPIKSGTVSANNGVVTLSLAVDFGPLPRRVLDAVEALDGQRVLLVGRAAQGAMFSGD